MVSTALQALGCLMGVDKRQPVNRRVGCKRPDGWDMLRFNFPYIS